MYQIHVRESPGRPWLAVACTAGSLALATAVCGLFVWQQRSGSLGGRWRPPGWGVSFAPPGGWERRPLDPRVVGFEGYRFRSPRGHAVLWAGRFRFPGQVDAASICRMVIRSGLQNERGLGMLSALSVAARASVDPGQLGELVGVSAHLRPTKDVFLVGVPPPAGSGTEAYLLAIFPAGPLDARDLRICTAVVDSFAIEGKPD